MYKSNIKKFVADDVILVEGKKFEFNSIVSYSIEKGECPIDALAWLEHAKAKWPHAGHVSHWLAPSLVCLSLAPREQKAVRGVVEFDEMVQFEGRYFYLKKANNDNVELVDAGIVSSMFKTVN
jgi:hypothetical protein